jgi:hypothetical protein
MGHVFWRRSATIQCSTQDPRVGSHQQDACCAASGYSRDAMSAHVPPAGVFGMYLAEASAKFNASLCANTLFAVVEAAVCGCRRTDKLSWAWVVILDSLV